MSRLAESPTNSEQTNHAGQPWSLSVIVPFYAARPELSELEASFRSFLAALVSEPDLEVWVCDSGSALPVPGVTERAFDRARASWPASAGRLHYHYAVTDGPPQSRAEAMNEGVGRCRGSHVLFLHIDCRLADGALAALRSAVSSGALAGGFTKRYIDKPALSLLHVTELYLNEARARRARRLVGTNAMFLARELALEHPCRGDFLEDVELSDWLRRRLPASALVVLDYPVAVSCRKYRRYGVLASVAVNAAVMILYRVFRVSAARLRRRLYHYRFPVGWRFWPTWLGRVLELIDAGGRRG